MNIKTTVFAAAGLAAATLLNTSSAFAQQDPNAAPGGAAARRQRPQGGGRQAQPQMGILAVLRNLNLTPEQTAKVRALTEKLQADVKAILTPEQLAQAEKEMENMRQGGGAQGNALASGMMEQLSTNLNLTDSQKAQIQPILEDMQKQMLALRQDQSLQGRDRQAKMMSIMNDSRSKVRPLLTPEQQTKFDAMQMGGGRQRRPGQAAGGNGGADF